MKKWLKLSSLVTISAILLFKTIDAPTTKPLSTKATNLSWTYSPEGSPNGLVGTSSPAITYPITIKKAKGEDYILRMYINNKEVAATYDGETGLLSYESRHLVGKQNVNVKLEAFGEIALDISWDFTVDSKQVNPFFQKNLTLLSTIQKEALDQLNAYRKALKLGGVKKNDELQKSSQAHSNYLATNGNSGHDEVLGLPWFTGEAPWNRASYFGYIGSVGEGITYQKRTGYAGIIDLMDAPYHRLSIIDPFIEEAGVGFNTTGDIIVNYGNPSYSEKPSQAIVYPYSGQTNVKNTWYVAETPNPLRFYQLSDLYVGYPISFAYFSKNPNDELIVNKASLKDSAGKAVPVYYVTPQMDDHGKHHVFIIPKAPLQPGAKYQASVGALIQTDTGVKDVSKTWTFSTAGKLEIKDIYFKKESKVNFIQVDMLSGNDPYSTITLEKNDVKYLELKKHQQTTYRNITAGTYDIKITSPLYKIVKKVTVTISKNISKRSQHDGDWLVKW